MKNKHCNGKDFDFLIGKSIKKVESKGGMLAKEGYILTCNDGTIIEIEINEGCGGCENGWSSFEDLKKLEGNNNVITNIKVEYSKDYWSVDKFTMFIYYEDGTINELIGDDGYGNGYYGGGFYVTITNVEESMEENK